MAETRHTPGPWKIVSDQLGEYARAAFNPWRRVLIGTPPPTGAGPSVLFSELVAVVERHEATEERAAAIRADVRLIAAAPELLHAVRELQWLANRQLRSAAFSAEETERAGRALDDARAAIARAEGRSDG